MSYTLTFSGNQSMLETTFHPPLILEDDYECGLLYFSVFNAIPNITSDNNVFTYGEKNNEIKIPNGSYDLLDIYEYINDNIDCELRIKSNCNTSTVSIYCSKSINFKASTSIGSILGFQKGILEANKWHVSVNPVSILPVSVIRIECDLVQGSYIEGISSHIIYEFMPNVSPCYRFIEKPINIIYFPVKTKSIASVTVKIIDQNGNNINFGGENIQMCIHLRKPI